MRLAVCLASLAGLALALLSHRLLYEGPVLSDEVTYAVVARNLVEAGSLDTNLYSAESIERRGWPTRDYHTPGYMLVLAASMSALGVNDLGLALPSLLAYGIGAILFFLLGRSLAGPGVALLAAVLFLVYPINFVYSSLIMVEASFALCAAAFLVLWQRASAAETLRLRHAVLLAAVLVAGALLRKTFLVFLPPAVVVLLWSGRARGSQRFLVVFSVLFLAGMLGVYGPLAEDRSYCANPYDRALEADGWVERLSILWRNALANLAECMHPLPEQRPMALLHLGLGLTSVLSVRLVEPAQRGLAWLSVYAFWASVLAFTVFFESFVETGIARNLGAFCLPALLISALLLSRIRPKAVRIASVALAIAGLGAAGLHFARVVVDLPRAQARESSERVARALELLLGDHAPRSLIVPGEFRYAWTHYPATLVWRLPSNDAEMEAVLERLEIEVIGVPSPRERQMVARAAAASLLGPGFLRTEVDGTTFFVREDLARRAGLR